ncbi:inositol monophosphatase family protein [Streptococcus sp.]|nr:inositol monophosphatase family protein [Streptococcus sp.]MDY3824298.1 inositol monophosphatase family protein [Streptococcus sp.]
METKFEFAKSLIKEAGALVKESMKNPLEIASKSQFDDLVTNVDQATQQFLVEQIKLYYPNDFILAEEGHLLHPIDEGNVWVLDPIDGTVNFVSQGQDFAIMLAYYEAGVGQFGIIYNLMGDQLYAGGGVFPVTLNGQELSPYKDKPISQFLIAANSGMYAHNTMGVGELIKQSLGLRVYGSAGISMSRVLEGKLMAYFSCIYPWDYAAASIMGESLGYVTLTMTGEHPDFRTRQAIMFVPKDKLTLIQSVVNEHS